MLLPIYVAWLIHSELSQVYLQGQEVFHCIFFWHSTFDQNFNTHFVPFVLVLANRHITHSALSESTSAHFERLLHVQHR